MASSVRSAAAPTAACRGACDLRAWGAAAEDDHQRQRDGGHQDATAYHGRMDLDAIRRLPKAELHQHLDGSVRPSTAVELAAAIGMPLTLDEATRRMVGPERCADQAELLTFFDLPIALLQTAEALERATAELVEDLAADGIRYAEVRWAPRLHLERGLSVADVIEAVAAGVARATADSGRTGHRPDRDRHALSTRRRPTPSWRAPPGRSAARSSASTSPDPRPPGPHRRTPSPSSPRARPAWR